MLEIKEVRVRWWHNYANSPEFELVVDDAWGENPYSTWEHKKLTDDGLYLAMNDPWAHFVAVANKNKGWWVGQGQCKGELLLEGGETLHVFDGWSSRASYVNLFLPEENHIADVVLYGGKYRSGRGGLAIKVSKLRELIEDMDGVYIIRDPASYLGDEPHYIPSASEKEPVKG